MQQAIFSPKKILQTNMMLPADVECVLANFLCDLLCIPASFRTNAEHVVKLAGLLGQ